MADQTRQAAEISLEEIRARLGEPSFVLADVLPAESYRSGHIPGAISLPLADIDERTAPLIPDRNKEIAVYCGGWT